jgi:cellulose synthase (UDP-forming)
MFNVFPMRVDIVEFLLRWTPYFVLNILANSLGGRHYFRYFQTEKYNILKMVVFIQSTLTLFSRKSLKFKVTPKSVDNAVYKDERKTMRFYMVILGAITGAILYGFWKTIAWQGTTLGIQAFLIALLWAAYNAMLIIIGIYEILGKQHERKQYRFQVELEAEIRRAGYPAAIARARIDNLSIAGASFTLDSKFLAENSQLLLHFYTSGRKFIMLPIDKIHRQFKDSTGRVHVGVSFSNKMDLYRERLFEYLFVELPGMQPVPVEPKTVPGTQSVFQKLLSQRAQGISSTQLIEDTLP